MNVEEGMAAAIQNALSCIQAGSGFYRMHGFTRRIRWAYDQSRVTNIMSEEGRLTAIR